MVNPNQRFYKSEEDFRNQAESSLIKKIKTGILTEEDAGIIRTFISEVSATKSISNARRFKLTSMLANSRKWVTVPFRQMTTPDLFMGLDAIQNDPKLTQNSKGDFIRCLKRVSLWMIENDLASPGLKPEKVRKITPPAYTSDKDPGQMLTPSEVKAMIDVAGNSRDRALIAVLYEGGLRIGEVGNLQWKQVQFSDWNVSLKINFKTGKTRHIPLVMSMPYLKSLANDRGACEPEDFVFLTPRGEPLQYQAVRNCLKRIGKKAGINKPLNPHGFRHSRITEMVREGFGEAIVKKVAWGHQNSKMMAVYTHLVDDDVDRAIAEKYGIVSAAKKIRDQALDPVQCSRCGSINQPGARFCDKCGLALSDTVAMELEGLKSAIHEDPRYIAILKEIQNRMDILEGKVL